MKKLKTTVKKSNKKRVSKNDIGYGVKVKALEEDRRMTPQEIEEWLDSLEM